MEREFEVDRKEVNRLKDEKIGLSCEECGVSMYKYLHLSSKKEVKIGRNRPASSSFFSRRLRSSLQAPPRETRRDTHPARCPRSFSFFLFFFLFQMLDEIPFFSRIPERRHSFLSPVSPADLRTFKKSLYSRGRAQNTIAATRPCDETLPQRAEFSIQLPEDDSNNSTTSKHGGQAVSPRG